MKWVRDRTTRFIQRPYYSQDELDSGCEELVSSFLIKKYGTVCYPISTNDLTILIEQHTSTLDLFADLTAEGTDVEGMTEFVKKGKPRVSISANLSADNMENRQRTTLMHELGHVKYHNFL